MKVRPPNNGINSTEHDFYFNTEHKTVVVLTHYYYRYSGAGNGGNVIILYNRYKCIIHYIHSVYGVETSFRVHSFCTIYFSWKRNCANITILPNEIRRTYNSPLFVTA